MWTNRNGPTKDGPWFMLRIWSLWVDRHRLLFPIVSCAIADRNGFTSFATPLLDRQLPTGSNVELVRDCLPQGGRLLLSIGE